MEVMNIVKKVRIVEKKFSYFRNESRNLQICTNIYYTIISLVVAVQQT